jgi:hypothetical protein
LSFFAWSKKVPIPIDVAFEGICQPFSQLVGVGLGDRCLGSPCIKDGFPFPLEWMAICVRLDSAGGEVTTGRVVAVGLVGTFSPAPEGVEAESAKQSRPQSHQGRRRRRVSSPVATNRK